MELETQADQKQVLKQEYDLISKEYGDRIFKITLMQEEIKQLFQKMAELSQKLNS